MASRSSRPHTHALGDVLKDVIRSMGAERELDKVRIVETWATVAGPHVNAVTDKVWVQGHALVVKVHSAPWRHELHARRHRWLARLNEELGADLVKELIFR